MTYTDSISCDDGGDCDFFFKNVLIQDEDNNELHKVAETGDTGNTDTVDFSDLSRFAEAFEINISSGKRIKISFEVWDKDAPWSKNDLKRNLTAFFVPFSSIEVANDWRKKLFTIGENEATLTIQYRLTRCGEHFTGLGCNSCEDNYYGTECSKYCKPKPGYYDCDSSGEIVCEEKRTGDSCNNCKEHLEGDTCERCVEGYYPEGTCDAHCLPDPEKYDCTDQGEKECRGNRTGSSCEQCVIYHFGEDCTNFCKKTTSYNCDESGEKDCRDHFYPPQKCDTHCEPVVGNYTCNQMTGEKICVEGKKGEDCDECLNSNKEGRNCEKCIEYYHGENCTIYCKPDNEHYHCSENGTIICSDSTTSSEHDCRRPNKDWNIPLIGAAGGGIGLFLMILLTCIIVKVRKDRNRVYLVKHSQRNLYQEDGVEKENRKQGRQPQIQPGENKEAIYSTVQSHNTESGYPTAPETLDDKHNAYNGRFYRYGGLSSKDYWKKKKHTLT